MQHSAHILHFDAVNTGTIIISGFRWCYTLIWASTLKIQRKSTIILEKLNKIENSGINRMAPVDHQTAWYFHLICIDFYVVWMKIKLHLVVRRLYADPCHIVGGIKWNETHMGRTVIYFRVSTHHSSSFIFTHSDHWFFY